VGKKCFEKDLLMKCLRPSLERTPITFLGMLTAWCMSQPMCRREFYHTELRAACHVLTGTVHAPGKIVVDR